MYKAGVYIVEHWRQIEMRRAQPRCLTAKKSTSQAVPDGEGLKAKRLATLDEIQYVIDGAVLLLVTTSDALREIRSGCHRSSLQT